MGHEDLIPTVLKTQVKVDLYWKCYAYGDELKPHIEFLDAIMLSSTRDIAPSCVENVDELIERQEKSLSQLESKRGIVNELIVKGKALLENPDKPKFLEAHLNRIIVGWDDTKEKAQTRLTFLQNTKAAWVGYYSGLENIAVEFEKAEEEIKKVKKRFNLQSAFEDLEKRQKLFNETKKTIDTMWANINADYEMMTQTLPEDKKDFVKKEVKAVGEKLPVVGRFQEKVQKIETFVTELQKKVMKQCDHFSEDVKFWAEYKTGIKSFKPWLEEAEKRAAGGLSKPQTPDEANAMFASTSAFDEGCLKHIKVLSEAEGASKKMTTHKEADDEVAALKERYTKVKAVSDEWMKKVDSSQRMEA